MDITPHDTPARRDTPHAQAAAAPVALASLVARFEALWTLPDADRPRARRSLHRLVREGAEAARGPAHPGYHAERIVFGVLRWCLDDDGLPDDHALQRALAAFLRRIVASEAAGRPMCHPSATGAHAPPAGVEPDPGATPVTGLMVPGIDLPWRQ
ncbi:MAG: hypothetical protein AB1416_04635 [Actinomycetota bacterium]